jgi:xylulokinase
VLTYPHALPGLWYTVAATNTAATAYTWLREALFESDGAEPARLYAAMDAIAVGVDPGAGGVLFLPFLDGERTPFWDADLRGAFLGLATWHSRPHLCRAVLEGVALSLRSCRDVLREIGLSVECPQLAGGGTASEIWTEILVSILGEPAAMTEPQGPALGAAMLAAQSTGATPGRPGYVRTETLVPRSDWAPLYDDVYSVYRLACEAMKRLSKDLGRLSTPLSKRAGVPV